MVNYTNVIQVGLAMLAIIALGFVLSKLRIILPKDSGAINIMVYYIGFFPLLFRGIASKKLSELDFNPFWIAALMSISTYVALAFLLPYPFKNRLKTYLATVFPTVYINYVISGVPVFNALWPPSENVVISMMTMSNDMISSPIYFVLVGIYSVIEANKKLVAAGLPPERFSFKILCRIFLGVIKSPILIGIICGIIYSAIGLKYPIFLDRLMGYSGDMIFALSLVCVGVFLAQHSLISCGWVQFIFCMFVRIFVGPFFALLWCMALKVPPRIARQCIIIGSQPTAVATYTVTSNAHIGEGVASTLIFWTTVLVVPTIIVWFSILDGLKLFVE